MSSTTDGVAIQPHETKGRALHVTRTVPAGAVIAVFAPPLLLIPSSSHLTSVCSYCLRASRPRPRPCSRCKAAYYCDARCQAAAWTGDDGGHRLECAALVSAVSSARKRREIPSPVRALVRILLSGSGSGSGSGGGGGLGAAMKGLRAAGTGDGEEGWRRDLEVMARGGCAFARLEATPAAVGNAMEILCQLQTNAFHRFDEDLGHVGIFLDPVLAMANHSCMPNALVQFVGRTAVLRAESSIQKGDEIEISYTDYTSSLPRRKAALQPYGFECHCRRCTQDLSVYQASALYRDLMLNEGSILGDATKLQKHPAAASSSSTNKHEVARAAAAIHFRPMPADLDERRPVLAQQLADCKPLADAALWAVAPLPQTLAELVVYYAERHDYALALATAALLARDCDPYRFPAPFHPVRAKNVLVVAKLLSNTAADTAALEKKQKKQRPKPDSRDRSDDDVDVGSRLRAALRDVDQVSLAQMLLFVVLETAPPPHLAGWEVAVQAREMMAGLAELDGREQELGLIREWRRDPKTDRAQAFFEYAVVQQVDLLADLGRDVLREDFGI